MYLTDIYTISVNLAGLPGISVPCGFTGGGLPIGATLLTDRVAAAMEVGDHGSTFAGGPVICRAAEVVLRRVSDPYRP